MNYFKILTLIFLCIFVIICGCSTVPEIKKNIFRCDGGWYIPPAFHGNAYAPGGDGTHMHFIWERAFLLVPETNGFIPRLAVSHEISEDRKQLTLHLRDNVLWHDEKKFTSKDIQTSFFIKYAQGWGGDLKSINCPDDLTVIFEWRKPFSNIEHKVIFNEKIMAPFHLYGKYVEKIPEIIRQFQDIPLEITEEKDTYKIEKLKIMKEALQIRKAEIMQKIYSFRPSIPIGTGPFKFRKVSASDLVLEKFLKGWEASTNTVDEVRILKGVSNDITWAYLISGEIDVAHPATSQDVTEQILKLNKKMKLVLPSDYGEFGFIFNTAVYPLDDLQLRKAITYGVNKDLVRLISYYYSTTVGSYNTGVIDSMKERFLLDEFYSKAESYDYNIEKSHEILAKAGYKKDKNGFYLDKLSKPLKIEISSIAGESDSMLACESLRNQLKKIGIDAQIRTYEPSLFHQLLATNKFDMAANFGTDYRAFAHPAPSFNRYFGDGAYIKTASGIKNILKNNEGKEIEIKELIKSLFYTNDEKEFKKIVSELAWMANEYLPFLTIYEKRLMIFLLDGVNVTGWPEENDPIWSASSTGLEAVFAYLISTGRVRGVHNVK